MKIIKVEDAVGTVLCHDITQIIPGEFKGAKFKKGHVIKEEDIPILLSIGKKHLYVYEVDENMIHENDAAIMLRDMCINEYMSETEIKEGKIELKSTIKGFFKVDRDRLKKVNMQDELMIATIKDGDVDADKKIAGMRVIPLVIDKKKLIDAKMLIGSEPLLKIYPYKIKTYGLIVTGSEVYNKLIDDKFSPVVENKLLKFGVTLAKKIYCDDDKDMIVKAIKELKDLSVDMIICTGGMSVDPDDMTPSSIIESGAKVVSYGSPMLPGAMLLIGYFENDMPILGLPGCVMYAASTVFDAILPKTLAKIKWTKEELAELGYGGLCQNCKVCHFPNCTFGN
ncbi:MAG: molybdopterin-binding protein [Lachnospiraceae bacterium]|nr:molybdopterin-binding protein [Lachnospiraceae bacterium]